MSDQSRPVCIFECSSNTYADCVQKGLFGSNPARRGVKAGDSGKGGRMRDEG
jgi:hypothetical protein